MSKAFVRESDSDDLPELPPLASPLPPGAKNYFTAGGLERVRSELAQLVDRDRPPLAAAAAHDIEAKRQLQALDQRIRYLQNSLQTAEVVTPPSGSPEVVRFGTTVTVRENGGNETRYRIVGVDETDLDRNWVSWLSPIARALTNTKVGQVVPFKAPRGRRELEVVRIEYEA
jgi:transcription elongation factor GreB